MVNIDHARHPQSGAQPGEYWLVSKDGEQDWPVVICDEEMVQAYFRGSRPENARKADGTWHEVFQRGSDLLGQVCFPVLYLGSLKLRWASWNRLKPLDFHLAVAIRDTTPDIKLKEGYQDAIGMYEWNRLGFWKDKLCAMKLADETAPGGSQLGKRKRGSTPDTKSKPSFERPPRFGSACGSNYDDDDEDELFLAEAAAKRRKVKKEVTDAATLEEINALYENSDGDDLVCAPGRSRLAVARRFGSLFGTPATMPGLKRHASTSMTPGKSKVNEDERIDLSKITLYVGNPHVPFPIKRTGLESHSPLLARLVSFHPNTGYYIMSPLLSSLSPDTFKPIAQYLDYGEYYPNLLDEGTEHARLEDLYSYEQRVEEIRRCGGAYAMAQKLGIGGLRALAFRKLRVLGPWPRGGVLEVVGMVEFSEPGPSVSFSSPSSSSSSKEAKEKGKEEKVAEGDGMRGFVVSYLKNNFLELMKEETEKMVQVLEANWDGLAKQVFRELGREHDETLKTATAKKYRDEDGVTDSILSAVAKRVHEEEEADKIQERLERGCPGLKVHEV